MNIYVASSWRNQGQPEVVAMLRAAGHDVYDFRHPVPGSNGFHWSEIDSEWKTWTPSQFRDALKHDLADVGFCSDMDAIDVADAVVLVLPCGKSAHLEAGYAVGCGKPVVALVQDGEPELMYKMFVDIVQSPVEVIAVLEQIEIDNETQEPPFSGNTSGNAPPERR